ncbi:MAG: hypothetical protein AUH85_04965 [Chloroflexi bacterium 13_1_40CM_4_68_4]|nr:MAG: hypothetical protein AUH85_04965 [Chloroflexi bacterium 13_1_40CM_4_68_4]
MSLIIIDDPKDRSAWIRETVAVVAGRIGQDRARLLARVAAASDADIARGDDDDRGLGQIATHLLIVERGVLSIALRLARAEHVDRGTGQPRPPVSGVSRDAIATLAQKAERDLGRFIADFPAEPDVATTARHPFYGQMNCFGWLLTQPSHYAAHLNALERGTKSAL